MLCGALFGSRVNAVVVCAAAGVAKGGVVVHAEGASALAPVAELLRATSCGEA